VLIVVSVARRFRFMKHRRLLAGLVAAALVIGLFAATATAQSSPDPKTRRNELSDAIEGASAAEAAAIQEVQAATARRQVLEARVAELEREVSGAVQKVEAAEAEVVRITAEIETVQREIERILAEIENLKSRFHESAVAMYKGSGNGSNSVLRLLSTAAGEHQLIAGSKYLRENSQRLESELERQGILKDQLDAARRDLEDQESKAREAKRVAAEERDRVAQLRAAADAEREQARAAEQQEQQVIEGIRARKAEFEAEYSAVQAEIQAQIAASLSRGNPTPAPQAGGPAPRPAPGPGPAPGPAPGPGATERGGRFLLPVEGRIGSGFGPRVHPIYGSTRMHTGVDIGAPSGAPIRAADDGVVVMAGWNGGYGNWTLIDHGGGLATGYGHQSSIGVSRGQRVSRGEVIGRVGSTGASTGPHLHWEVRVNGNPVNPMAWI
jgi:murein DD-endopeptidase MepM/ murein hydrolase activator NlpD